jgi:DNA-binding CsgD family transcriptional regulator
MNFIESDPTEPSNFAMNFWGTRRTKMKSTVLTNEERDVLLLGARHPGAKQMSNSEIGQRLGIPVTKFKSLIHQACIKLGADNRNEAIFLAMRRGEISLNELLSLDEMAEIFCSLNPEMLRKIAQFVRQNLLLEHLTEKDRQIKSVGRKHNSILTNRERDVIVLAGHGFTNKEIADRLCISMSAVRTFLNRASTKLGARKRADIVQLALKRREIDIDEITSFDELYGFLAPLGAEFIEKMAQHLEKRLNKHYRHGYLTTFFY